LQNYTHDVVRKATFEVLPSFRVSTKKNTAKAKEMICSALSENAEGVIYQAINQKFFIKRNFCHLKIKVDLG